MSPVKVEVEGHGMCELVGFSQASEKERAKGKLDPCVPLVKLPGHDAPQLVSKQKIKNNPMVQVWCVIQKGEDFVISTTEVSINVKTDAYHFSEYNAKKAREREDKRTTEVQLVNGKAKYETDFNHFVEIETQHPATFGTTKVLVLKTDLIKIVENLRKDYD